MPQRRAPQPASYVPDHGTGEYVVDHYALDLRYRVDPNRLEGTARLAVRAVQAVDELRLDLIGLRVSRVEVEAGGTVGPHSVVLPAARLGAGAVAGPASLVMRGEVLPAGSRWQGNPVVPWAVGAARRRGKVTNDAATSRS